MLFLSFWVSILKKNLYYTILHWIYFIFKLLGDISYDSTPGLRKLLSGICWQASDIPLSHWQLDLNTMTTDILNIIDFSNSYSRYWNFNVASSFVRKTYHIIYSRYDEGDGLLELVLCYWYTSSVTKVYEKFLFRVSCYHSYHI